VAQALIENQIPKAKEKAAIWQATFGDRFYLAVQRTSRMQDEQPRRSSHR
jgi:DNA polymerase III alpha subunit